MSIQTELQRIISAKNSIVTTMRARGLTVPNNALLRDIASILANRITPTITITGEFDEDGYGVVHISASPAIGSEGDDEEQPSDWPVSLHPIIICINYDMLYATNLTDGIGHLDIFFDDDVEEFYAQAYFGGSYKYAPAVSNEITVYR